MRFFKKPQSAGACVSPAEADVTSHIFVKHSNDYSIKINEAELALSINYRITSDKKISSFTGVGSFIGYGLSAKTIDAPTGVEEEIDYDAPQFNRLDFGILATWGIGYKLKNGVIFLNGTYGCGHPTNLIRYS